MEQIQTVLREIQDHRKDIRLILKAPALEYTTVSGQEVCVCVCTRVCMCVWLEVKERWEDRWPFGWKTQQQWWSDVCVFVSVVASFNQEWHIIFPVFSGLIYQFSSSFSSALSFWLRWRTQCHPLFHLNGSKSAGQLTHLWITNNTYMHFFFLALISLFNKHYVITNITSDLSNLDYTTEILLGNLSKMNDV